MNKKDAQIVIRRVKKVQGGGHHGGAWKVAYADFVTAMMAFFLVMWLVGSTTNKEKAAISNYFKNPSPTQGHSMSPSAGPNGPGGASTSLIKLGGTMDIPRGTSMADMGGQPGHNPGVGNKGATKADKEKALREAEHARLESLMDELKAAISKSQALAPFKDQLLLDITPLGLRIQIVDKKNRPMFDMGSAQLQPYTEAILRELAKYLNEVPNRISISGHTDVTPYAAGGGYSNWELSTDRANAARRALVGAGLGDNRVALVVGMASSVLFDKAHPTDPVNRRISILVMNKQTEDAELSSQGMPVSLDNSQPASAEPASAEPAPAEDASPGAPGPATAPPPQPAAPPPAETEPAGH